MIHPEKVCKFSVRIMGVLPGNETTEQKMHGMFSHLSLGNQCFTLNNEVLQFFETGIHFGDKAPINRAKEAVWRRLQGKLHPHEYKVAELLSEMPNMRFYNLLPMGEQVLYKTVSDELGMSPFVVADVIDKLGSLGVFVSWKESEYWLFNPYLLPSFTHYKEAKLFKNTIFAEEYRKCMV